MAARLTEEQQELKEYESMACDADSLDSKEKVSIPLFYLFCSVSGKINFNRRPRMKTSTLQFDSKHSCRSTIWATPLVCHRCRHLLSRKKNVLATKLSFSSVKCGRLSSAFKP